MGLQEKRSLKEFQDKHYPGLAKSVESAAGFKVPIEVKWETITADGYAHLYQDAWTKVYFTPLVAALKAITADDMGKDALKKALKKIVIADTKGNYYGDRFTFADGVLEIDHQPCSNIDSLKEREEGIISLLEKAL